MVGNHREAAELQWYLGLPFNSDKDKNDESDEKTNTVCV
jgi:hypothetical protein